MSGGDISDKLKYLIEEFERSSLHVVHIRRGDIEILLSRGPSASRFDSSRPAVATLPQISTSSLARQTPPAAPPSSASPPVASDIPPGCEVVVAPNIGSFYRSPKPGAAPYVEVGQKVAVGDELCLIEVMKLFTSVRAEVSGTIKAILVADGAMVDPDQPLFAIEVE
jgi:acetyl-CoA carboxylase biotin carboxyl carrier protein